MSAVILVSVLAGISAAGFVWFGWDLVEAFLNRAKRPQEQEPDESEMP
jgi:hypothetical protein